MLHVEKDIFSKEIDHNYVMTTDVVTQGYI